MVETKYTIAGLGEVLWDIYGEEKHLGGAPANFAAHVQQTGHTGLVLSRVGADPLGSELKSCLEDMGLDSKFVQTDCDYPTGTVDVTLDSAGVPSFKCTKDVAFDQLQFDTELRSLASKVDAVLFGTLAQRNETSRQTIMAFLDTAVSALKIYDINLRGWDSETRGIVESSLKRANCIKLNDDELNTLCQVFGRPLDQRFVPELLDTYELQLAAVTLGEAGALVWDSDHRVYSPGFQVKVNDTTGAGDAFAAGLVVKFLQNSPLEEMAEYANVLGAFVATRKGAVPKWRRHDLDDIRRYSKRLKIDPKI